jgi:hypothetical protein
LAGNLKAQCGALLEAFTEQQIDLYADPQLLADLRTLRVIEKSYGVRLVSPRGPSGHGDSATALSISLHLAKNSGTAIANASVHRQLLVYPT